MSNILLDCKDILGVTQHNGLNFVSVNTLNTFINSVMTYKCPKCTLRRVIHIILDCT